ncbi:MAG: DEAD/DEAH box helicase [Verrucomicrobiales bacterium]|nr:DEAD/DEAH box helicase [Verrucomicrobiales bacterium]
MHGSFSDALEGLQVQLQIPDLWQQEAIRELVVGKDVIVSAPTGAGKTFVFENLIDSGKLPGPGKQAVYTVPTRALANDKWRDWKNAGWNVGIATGDIAENLDAPVLVATLETQREKLISGNGPRILVIDEYQMIGDRQRGLHYELSIALAPAETQLLLLSGSVRNPEKVAAWLTSIGRDAKVVHTGERPVPLDEVPFEALPRRAPDKTKNFWQRLALATLLSNYGPLLIFAPHRKSAEKIASKIADALPDDLPIEFSDARLQQVCSKELSRLLRKRVACHHSGISFAERAAIIEPLAKAGQLRVVVATMGLAAGINFSVRSVFVSDRIYQDGPFEREVSPDELLQMFGRAGRRGLDKTGYVIFGNRSPRLGDARALDLRRANEIDWPTLLRKMKIAVENGEDPFEAARHLCQRLVSQQKIALGFRGNGSADSGEEEKTLFGLKAVRKELLNSAGEWEPIQSGREQERELSTALSFVRGKYRPSESSSPLIEKMVEGRCRLTRLDNRRTPQRRYGVELMLGEKVPDSEEYRLTKFIRKVARLPRDKALMTMEEAESLLPSELENIISPAKYLQLSERGSRLYIQGHFADTKVKAYRDNTGAWLIDPQIRSQEIKSETHYIDAQTGQSINPGAGTPAHTWRKLGLIDDQGRPTNRGVICGFFQHGEGLAVAAALEDAQYPVDEMVYHFANLRAGYRFELNEAGAEGGSERLATCCRQAYGPVDFEGYLHLGLPTGYGEGAAEVVRLWLEGKSHLLFTKAGTLDFGPGDIERAFVEWLSFLRHVRCAPDADIPGWMELKKKASELLAKHDRTSPLQNMPSIPASILQRPPQNGIAWSRLR